MRWVRREVHFKMRAEYRRKEVREERLDSSHGNVEKLKEVDYIH